MSDSLFAAKGGAAVRSERPLSKVPQYLLYGLSAVGIAVAAFVNPVWSAFDFLAVLVIGSGLLFYDRVRAVAASRKGHVGARYVSRFDQGAVLAMWLACVVNGLVVAVDLARG